MNISPTNNKSYTQEFPENIGSFVFKKEIDNEKDSPGAGYTIIYHANNIGEATIYTYDKGLSWLPNDPLDPMIMSEFDQSIREIFKLVSNRNQNIEFVEKYVTGTPERGKEFLCAKFILDEDNKKRSTFLYLSGFNGNFIKIIVYLDHYTLKIKIYFLLNPAKGL